MAKKAKKKSAVKSGSASKKTRKVIAVKSVKARKPAAKKPARKAARRSRAETAKLQKTILKGLKGGKSVATLAEELGISRPYVYMLKNKG
jgi:hypothetical protein